MENILICPSCQCNEIGKGTVQCNGMAPYGKMFAFGSCIICDICTNCGLIIQAKVEIPSKFKPK